jgi:hypothetical protein
LNFAILFGLLRGRIGNFPGLGVAVLQLGLASVAVALACIGVRAGVQLFVPIDHTLGRALVSVLALPVGLGAFAVVAAALGVREVADLARRLRWRLGLRSH